MQLQEAFGKAVRSVREQKNLTQAQLAERAGIHLSAVSHVERARRQSSFETLIVVAQALDTPLSTLMRLAEEMMKIKQEGTTVDLPPDDEQAGNLSQGH
ncbi:helix-turn-helix domain-containing protein [Paraburkholderia azotifigens]|jgi:transcriptional regulator with XRE-family HTH domain|uniref:helix-turn-helix domain-containing protein n=1 Tax=Paraburkholderia azotifigens TaxID=2057004 RepID=UPI003CCC821C